MSIKKLTDWTNYWYGLRANLFKCIGTTGTMWLGSNGLASTGIPGTGDVALNWHQAVGMFAVHIGLEVFTYMKNKQPEVIEKEMDTQIITKVPLLIGGLILFLSSGCIHVHQSEITKDGVRKDFDSTAVLSASAVKGLNANSTTGTTSTGVKMESAESRADAEAIKAMGEMFGAAFGEAAKKSFRP